MKLIEICSSPKENYKYKELVQQMEEIDLSTSDEEIWLEIKYIWDSSVLSKSCVITGCPSSTGRCTIDLGIFWVIWSSIDHSFSFVQDNDKVANVKNSDWESKKGSKWASTTSIVGTPSGHQWWTNNVQKDPK